jgi:hypothetical protein
MNLEFALEIIKNNGFYNFEVINETDTEIYLYAESEDVSEILVNKITGQILERCINEGTWNVLEAGDK